MLCLAPAESLGDPSLENLDAPPPGDLRAEVRDALAHQGFRVSDGGKILAEIWLRREIPPRAGAAGDPGVNFGTLGQGTLIGAARFPARWSDYRGHGIAAGVYTLRYALQPADGYHIGVSEYRDFLLLVPAAEDPGPDARPSRDELIALSRKASGRPHPAVLALLLIEGGETPALVKTRASSWTLGVPCGSFRLGLVVIGRADTAE